VGSTEAKDQQSEYQYVVESQPSGSLAHFAYRKSCVDGREWKRLDQRQPRCRGRVACGAFEISDIARNGPMMNALIKS
jgi:hypothetical protein